MVSVRSTGRPIEVTHGRPDPTRPPFPATSSQRAAKARRATRRAQISDAAALAQAAILRATPAQVPALLERFHTLDSRVRAQVVARLSASHPGLARRFHDVNGVAKPLT